MELLEQYARDEEEKVSALEVIAVNNFRSGELDEKMLKRIIEEAYRIGHYAGHCRGELSIRKGYGLDVAKA